MNEFAALLLVSTLFGGMMLYSFGFAPMVFRALPTEDAGRFIRAAFPWYYLFVIVTAGFSGAILLLSNSWSAAPLNAGVRPSPVARPATALLAPSASLN